MNESTAYTQLEQYCQQQAIPWERNAPLKDHCTFKIGGNAHLLISPRREEEIGAILRLAGESALPILVLGRGSNLLISDQGFPGVVLHLGSEMAQIQLVGETEISCDSGASLIELCVFAQEHGLTGLEFAYGIPGSVGGAIYMNAGAYGGEMGDALVSARHVCPATGCGTFSGPELDLAYRHSAYSGGDRVITGGVFRLAKGDKGEIRAKMDDYMNRRKTKQPLEFPSAGSTFKRPEGAYASALIDECGLKGTGVGGAMVSEKHAGFVVNKGDATCADVLQLIAQVQQEVKRKTGFQLEPEVKIIGQIDECRPR